MGNGRQELSAPHILRMVLMAFKTDRSMNIFNSFLDTAAT